MSADLPWLVDRQYGPWVVTAFLAEGGMARVWRVRHVETGLEAALKVCRSRDPEMLARAAREGRIQAALRHPNILAALDIVDADGIPGIVLDLIPGGATLDSELRAGPLPGALLDRAVAGVLDGVDASHLAGFIHRDLKPANVLLAPDETGGWTPRLADFGLARPEHEEPDARMTRAGFMLGSAAYMAPEQARDAGSVDARADLWSLGAMLYEMVGGVPPFDGRSVEEVLTRSARGYYRPLDAVLPGVAARWQVAVEACLQVDPEMRVPDVATLREVLRGERKWVSRGGARTRLIPGLPSAAPPISSAVSGAETFIAERAVDPPPVKAARAATIRRYLWAAALLGVLGALVARAVAAAFATG